MLPLWAGVYVITGDEDAIDAFADCQVRGGRCQAPPKPDDGESPLVEATRYEWLL